MRVENGLNLRRLWNRSITEGVKAGTLINTVNGHGKEAMRKVIVRTNWI